MSETTLKDLEARGKRGKKEIGLVIHGTELVGVRTQAALQPLFEFVAARGDLVVSFFLHDRISLQC